MNTIIGAQNTADRAAAKRMLADAATLCSWCAGYWRDESEASGAGMVVDYAVDVDVVTMYSDPDRNTGYGHVFSQADDMSSLIAGLVGNYVLQRLHRPQADCTTGTGGRSVPLMLIPPHDAELLNMAHAIAAKQAAVVVGSVEELLAAKDNLSERLRGLPPEEARDGFLAFLAERATEAHNLLLGLTGAAAEMARLTMLPAGRLVPMAQHPAFSGAAAYRPPPSREGRGQDTKDILKDCNEWYLSMLEGKSPLSSYALSKIDDDAWVLATLNWINADAAHRGINRRLVLITGTERILEAGRKRVVEHRGLNNFADDYLRDPRAFIGAKDFFSIRRPDDRGDTEFRLLEWMGVLFPNAVRQRRVEGLLPKPQGSDVQVEVNLADLRAITTGSAIDDAVDVLLSKGYRESQEAPFPVSSLDEWRKVVRGTYTHAVLKSQSASHSKVLEELLMGLPEDDEDRLDALMARLSRRVQGSFDGLYRATGVIGVEQLLDQGAAMRGLPALRFALPEHADVERQYDALVRKLFKRDLRPDHFDLAKMYTDLNKDTGDYHAHVLHAFVYASTGRWFSARTLCRIALLVVDLMPQSVAGLRTGREAAYLMAVAERRLAIDDIGLKLASEALNDAIARARKGAANDPRRKGEPNDPRFASEALAQRVARRQIAQLKDSATAAAGDPRPDLEEALGLTLRVMNGEEVSSIRRWVVRQAVTNGLLAALLAVDAGRHSPQTVGAARNLIITLEVELLAPKLPSALGPDQLFADEVSDFVWLIAVAHFDSAPRSTEARAMLADWRPSKQPQSVLAYESAWEGRLLRLVGIERAGGDADAGMSSRGHDPTVTRRDSLG